MINRSKLEGGLLVRIWGQPYVLLTATALLWAGNTIVGRGIRADVTPVMLTFLRWGLALAIVAPFSWRRVAAERQALQAAWKPLLVLSFFGIALYNSLSYTGLQSTTAVNFGLLSAAMTPFTVLFAYLFFKERPNPRVLLGMAISIAGALTVISAGSLQTLLHLQLNKGDAIVIAAMASYAVYMVCLRRAPRVHPLTLLTTTFALGTLMLAPFAIADAARGSAVRWSPAAIAAILYVATCPSLLAYLLFNRGVALVGASRASLFLFLIPVFGAAMAVVFLGERLELYHWAGGALIAAGIVASSRRKAAA